MLKKESKTRGRSAGVASRISLDMLGAAAGSGDLPDLFAADIVYVDHTSWLRTLILYTGDVPARVNQPVLSPDGLVGRVITEAGAYAKVQLLTDANAAVGVLLERMGASRVPPQ